MADKSPRKQSPTKKLTTKEKQDRKRAKREARAVASRPLPVVSKGK